MTVLSSGAGAAEAKEGSVVGAGAEMCSRSFNGGAAALCALAISRLLSWLAMSDLAAGANKTPASLAIER
jgi:hypothetical protein